MPVRVVRAIPLTALVMLVSGAPAFAQGAPSVRSERFEISLGRSVNTDNIPNRGTLLATDRQVSPLFSHGSGPNGFEAAFTKLINRHVGITASVSEYSDTFMGRGTFCQSAGCATGLTFNVPARAFYVMAGPEFTARRDSRVSLFAHTLAGVVAARSTFKMTGSNLTYVNPFQGTGLIVYLTSGTGLPSTVAYSDSSADRGLAMTLGGGANIRLFKPLGVRISMDYDPTFLIRADLSRQDLAEPGPDARRRQDHVRVTIGVVWHLR